MEMRAQQLRVFLISSYYTVTDSLFRNNWHLKAVQTPVYVQFVERLVHAYFVSVDRCSTNVGFLVIFRTFGLDLNPECCES